MLVRDIMTTNIVTIRSNTPVLEARKIMETHNIRRLPVVDRGKLVGIVTKNITRRAAPTEATSLSVWEVNYLVAKMTVREVMKRDVFTLSPDTTVECAVATSQERQVGGAPVVEDGLVVGIVTTNDLFYKILNPLLGINETGKRIIVYGADTADQICKITDVIKEKNLGIKAMHTLAPPGATSKDLVVHLDTDNIADVMTQLTSAGFHVEEREYKPK